METNDTLERINKLFGSYRAEWLDDQVFDLFSEPTYFADLLTNRPCVLLGGRGTGKTTVLRCLSYEGQFALQGHDRERFTNQKFFGIFYRVDTNRVTAFRGGDQTPAQWIKLFGHYINLVLGGLFVKFLIWHKSLYPQHAQINEIQLKVISAAYNLKEQGSLQSLIQELQLAIARFEAQINNIKDELPSGLTIQGAPLEAIAQAASELPQFQGKHFQFLIDEYENLEDYQQRIVNTLIKHCGSYFTIKIGVRELGWRQRDTLNQSEKLISPADYIKINLSDKLYGEAFDQFALKVCNARISRIESSTLDVKSLFPSLSDEDEAVLLAGETEPISNQARALLTELDPQRLELWKHLSVLERSFIATWPEYSSGNKSFSEAISNLAAGESRSKARYDNYKHSLLFSLRRKKTGIRKYYTGWDVYAKLAAGNIRFFLELIDRALIAHLQNGGKWGTPLSPKTQTETAQWVGRKNLEELEGVDVEGAKLTKLLLGLGRVFQVMAADPVGHSPEVNQFQIAYEPEPTAVTERADSLIKLAVNHLAIIRLVGSKPSDIGDTKDSDYTIHPIFSAFFVFSYRRKRKMTITSKQLVSLVQQPRNAIQDILANVGRLDDDDDLPDQMNLFEDYYGRPN